jgi:hypothetical protein
MKPLLQWRFINIRFKLCQVLFFHRCIGGKEKIKIHAKSNDVVRRCVSGLEKWQRDGYPPDAIKVNRYKLSYWQTPSDGSKNGRDAKFYCDTCYKTVMVF